jgi:A118 family predicted phage portal protein
VPLPTDNQPWPPPEHAAVARDMAEADAWYSGDPVKLTTFYGGNQAQRPSDRANRISRAADSLARFWSRPQPGGRQRVHVPAAADVAATSADLLFGDEPRITIPEAHEDKAEPAAKATEDRLEAIAEQDGLASTLLEAAEVCSALGGVYLRPVWDPEVAKHPILSVVRADRALPVFRWGKLAGVTFWREVRRESNGVVWRHLECHEPGWILHGLYAGTNDKLGVRMKLTDLAETRDLDVDKDGATALPGDIKTILPRYVPNMLPNPRDLGASVGRSDITKQTPLMDSLDEAMSSWDREIRLAKPRILAPTEYLERGGRGSGAAFDVDAEVFVRLDMDPANATDGGITVAEFALHTEDYARTVGDRFERIVRGAGYSPQSFGLEGDGGVRTATEVEADDSRSKRTTAKKRRYWAAALADTVELMLVIDRELFGSGVEPMRPRVEFAEPSPDPRRVAETVDYLRRAQAASTETLVRMTQPDLEGDELKAEVQRILDENAMAVPDPTGGLP